MASEYGCWVAGCAHLTEYRVSHPSVRLVRPVESCRAHLGDLLGNAAKASFAQQPIDQPETIALHIDRLV